MRRDLVIVPAIAAFYFFLGLTILGSRGCAHAPQVTPAPMIDGLPECEAR